MVSLQDLDRTDDIQALPNSSPGATKPVAWNWLKRLVKEPLLHFLLLGIVLFGAYGVLQPAPEEESGRPLTVELTADDLRQLAVMWLAQGRPAPTPEQMRHLVDQKVTEEILAREAVALGLDRDDQIIKRRLAQKMDFLLADLAALDPPTEDELRAWFALNGERFALPPHLSFRHLYFSFDRHGERTREAAADALGRVAGLSPEAPQLVSIADPFMFRNTYGDATPDQMAKEFGPGFAEALFRLPPGSWQGPIESGYGWHLIWIDSVESGRIPDFEEVKPRVMEAWLDERYGEIKRRAFDEMRSRYTIVVPPIEEVDLQDLAAPPSGGSSPE